MKIINTSRLVNASKWLAKSFHLGNEREVWLTVIAGTDLEGMAEEGRACSMGDLREKSM